MKQGGAEKMAEIKKKTKGGLGKGFDGMIRSTQKAEKPAEEPASSYLQEMTKGGTETIVKISKIEPNRNQPRKNFDEDALQELSDSIKQYGLIQPIIVQDRKDHYEIIAGERRWRACKLAGIKEVPVVIKNFTEEEIVEISLIENIQREDLNPIEEAQAYKRLMDEFHFKQDEVAEKVSKSRSAVTNAIRLLKLSDEVQQMLIDEKLTTGHVRALLTVEDPDKQYELAQKACDEKLSVREVEKLVKQIGKPQGKSKKKEKDESLEAIYRKREELLKSKLNTKVSVVSGENGSGKLEIDFYSAEEFDKLCDLLMGK